MRTGKYLLDGVMMDRNWKRIDPLQCARTDD